MGGLQNLKSLGNSRDLAEIASQVGTNTEDITGLTAGVTETSIKAIMADGYIRNSIWPFDGRYATMASLTLENRVKFLNAILDVRILNADVSRRYALSNIKRNKSGEWQIYLYELATDLSIGTIKATFYSNSYVEPVGGIDVLPLKEYSSSGISGQVTVDWNHITVGASPLRLADADLKEGMLDVRTYIPTFAEPEIDLILPPVIHNVVGRETNVYFDNIMLCTNSSNYQIDVACSIGNHLNECYRSVGIAGGGTYDLTISVFKDSRLVAKSVSSLISKAESVGNGVNRKVLVIGDSTTAGGEVVTELNAIQNADVMKLTFVGTKGTGANLHEGISGWSVNYFYTRVDSPFVYDGVFDFAQYLTANSFSGLNHVIINLGINDVLSQADDIALSTKIAATFTQLESMITSIHAADANINVGICLTIPPSYNQDAFGNSYATGSNRWKSKRNVLILAKKMITQFANRAAELIYLVPINACLDTVNNMQVAEAEVANARSTTMVVRQSNGVHPALVGYYQIADAMWAYLKSFES